MQRILSSRHSLNIKAATLSLESTSPAFHVVILENQGGTLLPANALSSSKKRNRFWDH